MQPFKYRPTVNTGDFRHRIGIFGPVITKDKLHQEIETFSELHKVWAMVKTLQGREYIAAAQENAEHTTRFVVRYSKTMNEITKLKSTSLELHYDNNIYGIESIINDNEENKTFTIITKGRV